MRLWRSPALHLLVLVGAVAAAYAGVVGNGFSLDDGMLFLGVPSLHRLSLGNLAAILTSAPNGYEYLPVRDLTHLADYAFFGGADPRGFHLAQLAWYAAACAALYLLLAELFRARCREPGIAALLGSLLFALHPLHVEVAASLSQRKDAVSGLFFLLSLLFFLLARRKGGAGWWALSLAAALLSYLSKSTALALPVMVFLLDLLLVGGREEGWGRKALRALPYAALAAGAFAANAAFLAHAPENLMRLSSWGGGPLLRLAAVSVALVRDLLLALAPWPLLPFRPLSLVPPGWGGALLVAAGAALSAGAAALAGAALRRPSLALPAWAAAFFFFTLLPSLGFAYTSGQTADRYLFLPLAGLALVAGWGVVEGWERSRGWASRTALAAAFGGALGFCAAATVAQVPVWREPFTLYAHTFRHVPQDEWVARRLAATLVDKGRLDEGLAVIAQSEAAGGNPATLGLYAAYLRYRRGDLPQAGELLDRSLRLAPGRFLDREALAGLVRRDLGDKKGAEDHFRAALASPASLLSPSLYTPQQVRSFLALLLASRGTSLIP